ncbi:MAG: hypothetical protein ABI637_09790 [Gemmatimonadota bacterium]
MEENFARWIMDLNDAGPTLERDLRAAGLDPDHLTLADAWRVFTAWLRRDDIPADGAVVYVHLGIRDPTDALLHVTLIRHLEIADSAGNLDPVREIICDLGYPEGAGLTASGRELASTDWPDLESFLNAVVATPEFAAASGLDSVRSIVAWSEL